MRTSRRLDAVIAGLSVVDVIGRPIDLRRPPKRGGLQVIDSVTLTTGGNVPNYGIDLAKLGFRVGAITRVGNDGLGEFIMRTLESHRIDTAGVVIDTQAQTSSTIVAVGGDGERSFLHTRGCMARFRAGDVTHALPMIRRASVLAFGYLGLLPEMEPSLPALFARVKRDTGARILLDTAGTPRRSQDLLRRLLPLVDYFLPSEGEAMALTGARSPEALVAAFRRAGANGVVGVKLGERGSYISTPERAMYIRPVRVRRVVDATGAGDAFIAGFLAGTLTGRDPFDAARLGSAIAAECVTAVGASTAIRPLSAYVQRSRTL
jgi:sugar/nucleoside kinase (ribokinase family)